MNSLKALCFISGALTLLMGCAALMVFAPQYQPAAYVLLFGAFVFIGIGVIYDLFA